MTTALTKIRRCQDAGVKAVVMCAVHLKNTKDHLPDLWSMSKVGLELKRKYPGVIISPDSYFNRITWDHGCDTSSIIVNPREILSAWMPYYRDLLNGGKQPLAVAPAFAPRSIGDLAHAQILQESAMKGLDLSGPPGLELPMIQSPPPHP